MTLYLEKDLILCDQLLLYSKRVKDNHFERMNEAPSTRK